MSEIIYSRITEYIYVHTSQPFANHSRVMLGESAPIHGGDTLPQSPAAQPARNTRRPRSFLVIHQGPLTVHAKLYAIHLRSVTSPL